MSNIGQIIMEAIKLRKVIEFSYNALPRFVEPYCYGISFADNDVLRGYQISVDSSKGASIGWKLFTVNKIGDIKITNITFKNLRPGYNPKDSSMKKIYYCI
jgi:hypothetical protein